MLAGEQYVKSRGLAVNNPATLTLLLMDTNICADIEQVRNGSVHAPDDWVQVEISQSEESFSTAVTRGVSFTAVMSPWFWIHFMVTLHIFGEITSDKFFEFTRDEISLADLQLYHEYMSNINQSHKSVKQ